MFNQLKPTIAVEINQSFGADCRKFAAAAFCRYPVIILVFLAVSLPIVRHNYGEHF